MPAPPQAPQFAWDPDTPAPPPPPPGGYAYEPETPYLRAAEEPLPAARSKKSVRFSPSVVAAASAAAASVHSVVRSFSFTSPVRRSRLPTAATTPGGNNLRSPGLAPPASRASAAAASASSVSRATLKQLKALLGTARGVVFDSKGLATDGAKEDERVEKLIELATQLLAAEEETDGVLRRVLPDVVSLLRGVIDSGSRRLVKAAFDAAVMLAHSAPDELACRLIGVTVQKADKIAFRSIALDTVSQLVRACPTPSMLEALGTAAAVAADKPHTLVAVAKGLETFAAPAFQAYTGDGPFPINDTYKDTLGKLVASPQPIVAFAAKTAFTELQNSWGQVALEIAATHLQLRKLVV